MRYLTCPVSMLKCNVNQTLSSVWQFSRQLLISSLSIMTLVISLRAALPDTSQQQQEQQKKNSICHHFSYFLKFYLERNFLPWLKFNIFYTSNFEMGIHI